MSFSVLGYWHAAIAVPVEMPRTMSAEDVRAREAGFGKPDVSDVASACMIAAREGLARDLVADLIGAPAAELEVSATVVEVRS